MGLTHNCQLKVLEENPAGGRERFNEKIRGGWKQPCVGRHCGTWVSQEKEKFEFECELSLGLHSNSNAEVTVNHLIWRLCA